MTYSTFQCLTLIAADFIYVFRTSIHGSTIAYTRTLSTRPLPYCPFPNRRVVCDVVYDLLLCLLMIMSSTLYIEPGLATLLYANNNFYLQASKRPVRKCVRTQLPRLPFLITTDLYTVLSPISHSTPPLPFIPSPQQLPTPAPFLACFQWFNRSFDPVCELASLLIASYPTRLLTHHVTSFFSLVFVLTTFHFCNAALLNSPNQRPYLPILLRKLVLLPLLPTNTQFQQQQPLVRL